MLDWSAQKTNPNAPAASSGSHTNTWKGPFACYSRPMNFLIIIWREKYEYWVINTYYFVYYSYLNFHILRRSHLKKNGKQFSVEDSNDKMCVGLCVVFRVPWFKNEGLTLFPLTWVNQSFSKVRYLLRTFPKSSSVIS